MSFTDQDIWGSRHIVFSKCISPTTVGNEKRTMLCTLLQPQSRSDGVTEYNKDVVWVNRPPSFGFLGSVGAGGASFPTHTKE